MPDVSLLQPLCNILGISLNELFTGEHISEDEYKCKAEENISNLFKEKQIANLKPVKYVFSICASGALLVAAIELIVGFVGYFINPNILPPMLINAAVWLVLFLLSLGKLRFDKQKLRRLKQSGLCMDAEIEEMIPVSWIRIGNYVSSKIACNFLYEGREYKAWSNYYVLTPFTKKEELYARVYMEKDNPARYSVELMRKG